MTGSDGVVENDARCLWTDLGWLMRLVDPPKLVIVRREGRWCDGQLRAWRRDDIGWRGFVCYGTEPGLRWLEWVDAERVRPISPI
jgi:hypothetical protein